MTEEMSSISVTPVPPIISYSHSKETRTTGSGTPVLSSDETATNNTGGVVTITVTEPLTITTIGLRTITGYKTIRITMTELTPVNLVCITTTTYSDNIWVIVTEVVRYTSTVGLVWDTPMPYEARQTLKTSYETGIPSLSISLVRAITEVNDPFPSTTPEATEFSDTSTSGFPPVTLVTEKSNLPPYHPGAYWGE